MNMRAVVDDDYVADIGNYVHANGNTDATVGVDDCLPPATSPRDF